MGPIPTLLCIPTSVAAIHRLPGESLSPTRCNALPISRFGLTRSQCITPELPMTHRHPFNRLALTEVLGISIVRPVLVQGNATSMHSLSPRTFPGPLRPVCMPSAFAPKLIPGDKQLNAVGQPRALPLFRCMTIPPGSLLLPLPRESSTESYRPLVIPKQAHTWLLPQTAVKAIGRVVLSTQSFILQSEWSIALPKGVWTQ